MPEGKKRSKVSDWEKYQGNYIIPIMGPTGAGRSSFINQLLGAEVVKVGHSLSSCTVDLQPVEIPADVVKQNLAHWKPASPDRANLIVVDTPGFDDTSADDSEILKRIADWLAESYGAGAKLAGVIYLQDICQRRVTGATKRNFEVFDKLCGENACKSVVLGTTQWTRVPANEREMAGTREQELQQRFWNIMIGKGSGMQRVDDKNTNASPWNLVATVLFKGESPTLHIQREMMDLHKSLSQTEAASVLQGELIKSLRSAGASKGEVRAFVQEVRALKDRSPSAQMGACLSSPPMILVLGMTGVGKSTFICSAGPKHARPAINTGLSSSQFPVEEFEVESEDGRAVLLVDTPGFNDTEKSDGMVLDEIIKFLKSRKKDRKVAGVIYLLDASNKDYTPISVDKFEVPPSVVLATVHCHADMPMPNEAKDLLKRKYDRAYYGDHFGSSDQYQTAWRIICRVLDGGKDGVSVQPVIRSLEGILQNRTQTGGTGESIKQLFRIFWFRTTLAVVLNRLNKV